MDMGDMEAKPNLQGNYKVPISTTWATAIVRRMWTLCDMMNKGCRVGNLMEKSMLISC